jgi:hypothetical protein
LITPRPPSSAGNPNGVLVWMDGLHFYSASSSSGICIFNNDFVLLIFNIFQHSVTNRRSTIFTILLWTNKRQAFFYTDFGGISTFTSLSTPCILSSSFCCLKPTLFPPCKDRNSVIL